MVRPWRADENGVLHALRVLDRSFGGGDGDDGVQVARASVGSLLTSGSSRLIRTIRSGCPRYCLRGLYSSHSVAQPLCSQATKLFSVLLSLKSTPPRRRLVRIARRTTIPEQVEAHSTTCVISSIESSSRSGGCEAADPASRVRVHQTCTPKLIRTVLLQRNLWDGHEPLNIIISARSSTDVLKESGFVAYSRSLGASVSPTSPTLRFQSCTRSLRSVAQACGTSAQICTSVIRKKRISATDMVGLLLSLPCTRIHPNGPSSLILSHTFFVQDGVENFS